MRGILLEQVVVATLGRLLQEENRLGIIEMILACATPLVVAAGAQIAVRTARPLVRVGHTVPDRHFFGDFIEAGSPDSGCRTGEVFVNDFLIEADSFEQLSATIAHNRGHTHLAHDLQYAGGQCIGQILDRCRRIDLEVSGAGEFLDGFECKIRVDACGTIGDEQGDMVDFTNIAGFDSQGDLGAGMTAQQVMLDCAGEQKRRDRAPGMVGFAVRQHNEVLALGNRVIDFLEDLVQALLQCLAAACDLVQATDDEGLVEPAEDLGFVQTLQLSHLIGIDDRQRDEDLLSMQLGVLQKIGFRADRRFKAGDNALTLPIQRRIGDLGEFLCEVVEQHAAALGQDCRRSIRTHGSERFLASVRHRGEQQFEILFGIPEGALPALDRLAEMADMLANRQLAHLDGVAFDPLAVRMLRGEVMLDFVIRDDASGLGVDKEHLSRLETALGHDMILADFRQNARFGCEHQIAVVCELPAAGAEPVAVKLGAHKRAVREYDVRRPVPRFDQRVVVLVERFDFRVERVIVLPSGGQHHEQGVRKAAPGEMQQFQAFVESA